MAVDDIVPNTGDLTIDDIRKVLNEPASTGITNTTAPLTINHWAVRLLARLPQTGPIKTSDLRGKKHRYTIEVNSSNRGANIRSMLFDKYKVDIPEGYPITINVTEDIRAANGSYGLVIGRPYNVTFEGPGKIYGYGGAGGAGSATSNATNGANGGTAVFSSGSIMSANYTSYLVGGAGGGGGGGGVRILNTSGSWSYVGGGGGGHGEGGTITGTSGGFGSNPGLGTIGGSGSTTTISAYGYTGGSNALSVTIYGGKGGNGGSNEQRGQDGIKGSHTRPPSVNQREPASGDIISYYPGPERTSWTWYRKGGVDIWWNNSWILSHTATYGQSWDGRTSYTHSDGWTYRRGNLWDVNIYAVYRTRVLNTGAITLHINEWAGGAGGYPGGKFI